MEINRRDFVKLLGGSIVGFAVGGVGEALIKIPNAVIPLLYKGPRIETWKMTTCAKCPGKCGLRIRLIDGLPVQAFGNPLAPPNNGGVCPIGLTSVESLYHPDRLTSPMKKVNGKFQEISYIEAYRMLSNALLGKTKGASAFAAQTESAFMGGLIREFMSGINSDKVWVDDFASMSVSPYSSVSNDKPDFIDFSKCDFIINFGAQLTEVSESPSYFSRAINDFRAKRHEFVTFSPKLSPSAFKSSRWIPVLPEYYEDVALSLVYVILNDGNYDKNFVKSEFADFDGFSKLVQEQYSPAEVEARTGVPSKYIIETARKFSTASSPAAYFDESILHSSNGTRNAYAILALNAMKAFAGYGKLKNQELPDFSSSKEEKPTGKGWNPNMIIGDKDLKVLMIYRSNFVFNSPNAEALKKAIADIPMVVSFSPFIDETSELASLIIPDHDDLERLEAFSSTVTGAPVISMQQPVLKPFYSTVHTGDLLVRLVGDLQPSKKWDYKKYSDYLQSYLKPVYKRGKGMLMDQKKPTGLEKSLHQAGWQMTSYSSFDDFWDQIQRYGGWWNPFPETEAFRPKLSLTTAQLAPAGKGSRTAAGGQKGSLRLNVFMKNLDYKGNMLRNSYLNEQFGVERDVYYAIWIEINPDTAKKFAIEDRSSVKVGTAKGSFEATAIYNPAVMPGNIDVPFGLGHTVTAKTYGSNPLQYCDEVFNEETGSASFSETAAKVG